MTGDRARRATDARPADAAVHRAHSPDAASTLHLHSGGILCTRCAFVSHFIIQMTRTDAGRIRENVRICNGIFSGCLK